MPEWRPGVLAGLLAETTAAGKAGQRRGLLLIAAAIEAKAKAELAKTSHRYGTPSPAPRGAPPSLVTGTGRRSIGHQYIPLETIVKVGTIANVYPPASTSTTGKGSRSRQTSGTGASRGKTASSKYLLYQEKGHPPHSGKPFDHPFLMPSYKSVLADDAVTIWLKSFTWPRLV